MTLPVRFASSRSCGQRFHRHAACGGDHDGPVTAPAGSDERLALHVQAHQLRVGNEIERVTRLQQIRGHAAGGDSVSHLFSCTPYCSMSPVL